VSTPADSPLPDAVKSLADRIRDGAGGLFQAWEPAQNFNPGNGAPVIPLAGVESPEKTKALNNLVFSDFGEVGLQLAVSADAPYKGLATEFTPKSIANAQHTRQQLLQDNPDMVVLAEVRYRDAKSDYLPPDSPLWKRDKDGNREVGYMADGQPRYLLDYANPKLQELIADQCKAAVKSGAVDGVMLDWWGEGETQDRVNLVRKVREAIGENAVIIVNSNGMEPKKSAPYINGMYMEGLDSQFFNNPDQAAKTMQWAQTHLDPNLPPITALEAWGDRGDARAMREATTLALTNSNGFMLYGDKDGIPGKRDHGHDVYAFQEDVKALGAATGPVGVQGNGGDTERQYQNGTAVYNPPSNGAVELHFAEPRWSAATGTFSRDQQVKPGDGDLFLDAPPAGANVKDVPTGAVGREQEFGHIPPDVLAAAKGAVQGGAPSIAPSGDGASPAGLQHTPAAPQAPAGVVR
jgi:hypothetical protein